MNLNYRIIDKSYKDIGKVKHLFEHAFPIEERPPFFIMMSFKNQKFYAVELDDKFVGLVDLVIYKDTVYIFFLAVKKTYRHKGIGKEILKYVKEKFKDYRIYLMAEDPNVKCDNKEERLNRISFYNHNGFNVSNNKVQEYGVDYLLLYINKEVSKQDFLDTMLYLIGEKFYYSNYVNNVK